MHSTNNFDQTLNEEHKHPIAYSAMCWAAERFNATDSSFDLDGRLTVEAGCNFLRLVEEYFGDAFAYVEQELQELSHEDLNALCERQVSPLVSKP